MAHHMADEGGVMLVAGATGVAAQNLIDIVRRAPGWSVVGLSRNPPANGAAGVRYVAADLHDVESCRRALRGIEVTHVVYASRARHQLYTTMAPGAKVGIETVEANLAMLRNIVTACDTPALRHVHVVQGAKWYGFHLGPYPTPARESAPGHMPPNFYFDQHRFISEQAARSTWSWSTSRPAAINGKSVGGGPNFMSTIGAYAAICKHLGLPLDFPGKPGAYKSLFELTDSEHLAHAVFWMCRSPEAANQSFNVTNGDVFRWETVWHHLADHFGMKAGVVRYFPLVQWMADKAPVWEEIVRKHDLRPVALDAVASWGFADFLFGCDFDVLSSMTAIRKAGFHRIVDTEEMMLEQLAHYRQERILP